jgi:hypothetical protein
MSPFSVLSDSCSFSQYWQTLNNEVQEYKIGHVKGRVLVGEGREMTRVKEGECGLFIF